MLKIKISLALIAVSATFQVFAQTAPMTIQEFGSRQADLKRAKMDADLIEQKKKASPVITAAPLAATCDQYINLLAVYGVEKKLRDDFAFHGATFTLAPGEKSDVGGWHVEELTSSRALMVKRSEGKITSRCPIYLSNGYKPSVDIPPIPSNANVQVPPITAELVQKK